MKTKTLAAALFAVAQLLFISVTTHAQTANYIMKNDGSGNPVNTSKLFEYNGDYIGIGTVTPDARLQIHQTTTSPQPDYFAVTRTEGYPTPVIKTKFIVNGNGNVGIGTASPSAPLEVKINHWYTPGSSFGDNVMAFKDADDNIIGAFMNVDVDGTHPGGAIAVLAGSDDGRVSLAVVNTYNYTFPFAVLDNGTVVAGGAIGSLTPSAQLNFIQQNPYEYLVKMQSTGQTTDYLTVHNNGYVGIGQANSGNATLQVVSPAGATGNAGVIITGNAPNNRYLFIGNGTNPASAAAFLSVKNTGVGIGIDDLSNGAQLAVKGSSGTKLDLMETSSTVTDNAQIRFIANNGTTVRHKITEDASGNLLIDAGVAAGSDKVVINGNTTTTGGIDLTQTDPGSSGWYNQIQFHNGTGTTKQVIANVDNDLLINLNPYGAGSGVLKVSGKVQIGDVSTPGSYKLYVQDGILAERFKCALKSDNTNWSDYVFNKDYKLMSLVDLEKYVKKYHHLPNIPSAEEVYRDGIDLGEMDAKLLAKIEELTLYLLKQQEEIEQLKGKIRQ